MKSFALATLFSLLYLANAQAKETHTIQLENICGFGTPTLVEKGHDIYTGAEVVINGPFNGVAFLQTGECGLNGEGCSTVDINLNNNGTSKITVDASSVPIQFECVNPPCGSKVCPLVVSCTAPNEGVAVFFC